MERPIFFLLIFSLSFAFACSLDGLGRKAGRHFQTNRGAMLVEFPGEPEGGES